jgi:uncharacterized 2Fe-2S/4Fe-4S cluster protein (DUF4445 family)
LIKENTSMKETKASVQILPQKRIVEAYSGERLLDVLIRHSIFLRADCGGKGRCHKCRVEKVVENGESEDIDSCRHTMASDISIRIPESSMASAHVISKAGLHFPRAFKKKHWPDTRSGHGVAVDLGTTTIAVYLCDLSSGEVVSSVALKNNQALYGDDVMSRITAVAENAGNLEKLHDLAVKSIGWGVQTLLSDLGKDNGLPLRMVVVGNPTMIHIFTKTDPSSIGTSPFSPVFFKERRFSSDQLEFDFNDIPVQTLPNVSGFIGGDILAAAVAIEINDQPDGTLLIDLGTNGELILKAGEHLYAASCATGPAFEGATLSCGMQAMPGAINAIELGAGRRCTSFSVINPSGQPDIKPTGICGTGILNAVAKLCHSGVIRPDGAFSDGADKFILVPPDSGTGQLPIFISQKDIRSVQLGKSALMSGIELLLARAGLSRPRKIIVAGAMGAHVKKEDLIRLGMVPDIDVDRIEIAGNLAGSGAVMALCDEDYVDYAVRMADKIEVIELASNMEFQNTFIQNLGFPETEFEGLRERQKNSSEHPPN